LLDRDLRHQFIDIDETFFLHESRVDELRRW
jgi:hypothetical protein